MNDTATLRLAASLGAHCSADWRERFTADEGLELRHIVRTAFIDTMACILAGRSEPLTAVVAGWARLGDAALPVRARASDVHRAVLLNASCGHALDFDDVGLEGHPSVVLVPVLLAESESRAVHGFAIVQAYAKGYAVWAELQRRMKVQLHARGWHPSAVFGTLASAAAVCATRGLSPLQAGHALGLAASCSAGLIANFGSMTKSVQVGRAARSGLEAAELALAGIDASPDALDGPTGLLAALAGPGNAELDPEPAAGFEHAVLRRRPGIKKYPVCYAAHRVADGLLDLRAAHRIDPDQVERVDASISPITAEVLRHHAPSSVAEARFSLEFIAAAALVHGAVGIRELSAECLADPRIRRMMQKVHTHRIDSACPLEPSFAFEDRVSVTSTDGQVFDSGPIRFARGHAMNPLDDAQITAKLFACAQDDALARAVLARVDSALEP